MHGQYLGHACMYCTCPTVLEHLAAVADFSLLCHFFPSRYRMVICSQCATNEEASCRFGTESVLSLVRGG